MNYGSYQQYLTSDEWKIKARQRAEIDNYRCCMCGSSGTMNNMLHCHHITYRNIYHEDVYKDILTLCECCHKSVHIMMNRTTDKNGRKGWKDSLSISNYALEVNMK